MNSSAIGRFRVIDAHCGGSPLRLLIDGAPTPRGGSMRDKTAWMARRADGVRQTLMREPRGHRDMTGAMLTEPVHPGSHAGLVFMNADGYPAMAGHAVLAATLIALSHRLLVPADDQDPVVFDTVAGTVRARAVRPRGETWASDVAFVNVPSFVLKAGVMVRAGGRSIRADVAFGGAFYAIVDAESAGLGVDMRYLSALRDCTGAIVSAIESTLTIAHPLDLAMNGLAGVVFTGPPGIGTAQLRGVTVQSAGSAGRGPSGTGMSAAMAVLDAMGLLGDAPFEQEGLSGASFFGRVAGRTTVGDLPAIVPDIGGTAWITGEQVVLADPGDPFARGFPG